MIAVELPAEAENRLKRLAQAAGRSEAAYAREAILEHLDDLEDLHLAEQRLLEIRSGKVQAIPLETIMRRYGMAH